MLSLTVKEEVASSSSGLSSVNQKEAEAITKEAFRAEFARQLAGKMEREGAAFKGGKNKLGKVVTPIKGRGKETSLTTVLADDFSEVDLMLKPERIAFFIGKEVRVKKYSRKKHTEGVVLYGSSGKVIKTTPKSFMVKRTNVAVKRKGEERLPLRIVWYSIKGLCDEAFKEIEKSTKWFSEISKQIVNARLKYVDKKRKK